MRVATPYRFISKMSILLLSLTIVLVTLTTLVYGASVPTTITVSTNTLYVPVLQRAYTAYTLDHPTYPLMNFKSTSGSTAGLDAATANSYDFVVATISVPYAYQGSIPNTHSYPLIANAFAPMYNLPASVGSQQLVLDMVTSCRIWRRNITRWDHPKIKATNPHLFLSNNTIQVIEYGFASEANSAPSRMCTKLDPGWASAFGISSLPNIPGAVKITQAQGSQGMGSTVVDTPYSFGWAGVPTMATLSTLRNAALVNAAGRTVNPTAASTSQAFLEMAALGMLPDGSGFDLTNPSSAYAWPVSQSAWLLLDTAGTVSTCATKKQVLEFLLWFYESPLVHTLAESAKLASLPSLYLEDSSLLAKLRSEVICDAAALVPTDTTTARYQGSPAIKAQLALFSQLYSSTDSSYNFLFEPASDSLALMRVSAGEIDFAVVQTSSLTDEEIDKFTAEWEDYPDASIADTEETAIMRPGGLIIPMYLTGITITYALPLAITSLYSQWSTTNSLGGLPALYPLKIDLDGAAMVFGAAIQSWLDPHILQFNPQLQAWFDRTNAPAQMKTIVCCSDTADPMVAGTILTKALIRSDYVNQTFGSQASYLSTLNFWPSVMSGPGAGVMTLIEAENRLSAKLLMSPGSVSYRMINSAKANLIGEFHLVQKGSDGTTLETVQPDPSSMAKCVDAQAKDEETFQTTLADPKARYVSNNVPGCYPLTSLISVAVPSHHTNAYTVKVDSSSGSGSTSTAASSGSGATFSAVKAGGCMRAKHTLQLLEWLETAEPMETATVSNGLFRLAEIPRVKQLIIDTQLDSATCDGKTILITLPDVWHVTSSTTSFSIAAAAIGCALCSASLILLWTYRSHPIIRSSSPFFMAQVAIGLIMLFLSLPNWAKPATESSCLAFTWLANVGFTLAFAPLFAKTWRIYQIFSAKKIKVVKISNTKLLWMVLAMLAFELIVLSIWSGVSPLKPILYSQAPSYIDGPVKEMLHCSVDGPGMAFVGVEAAFKGALLFFGSLMGFSTRKVTSTFNESGPIAWAIYNVVFSGIIVAAIIVFINTLGETLILMVLLLLVWICYCTWAFIFLPKFNGIFQTEEKQQKLLLEQSQAGTGNNSVHTHSGGSNATDSAFSFANVLTMPLQQLQAYSKSLEGQLERVRRRMYLLTRGAQGSAGGSTGIGGAGTQQGEEGVLLPRPSSSHGGGDQTPPRSRAGTGDGPNRSNEGSVSGSGSGASGGGMVTQHIRGPTIGGGHTLASSSSNSALRSSIDRPLSQRVHVPHIDTSADDALKLALSNSTATASSPRISPDKVRRGSRTYSPLKRGSSGNVHSPSGSPPPSHSPQDPLPQWGLDTFSDLPHMSALNAKRPSIDFLVSSDPHPPPSPDSLHAVSHPASVMDMLQTHRPTSPPQEPQRSPSPTGPLAVRTSNAPKPSSRAMVSKK